MKTKFQNYSLCLKENLSEPNRNYFTKLSLPN